MAILRVLMLTPLLISCSIASVEVAKPNGETCHAHYLRVFSTVHEFNVDVCGGSSRLGKADPDTEAGVNIFKRALERAVTK